MPVAPFKNIHPKIHETAWISPTAWVTGEVEIAEDVSFFFGAVARGDVLPIFIGRGTNVQDNAMIHTSIGRNPTVIGQNVTIGHHAIIHGAKIGNTCIIGMGSTVLDDAVISDNCLIGANSLVTEGKVIPEGTLALGSPAKPVRDLTEKELQMLKSSAERYIKVASEYKSQNL
ncbi:MAG: gamma carbonic anhydrase family protein [Bdellovibrionales bacterium]|nr:gamma carbonic anhydrase family protein [Bdellovibrionales bacterium]